MNLSPTLKQARATANKNAIDAAATPGKMKCYSAPRPSPGGTPAGDLLATFIFTDPCGVVDAVGLHLTIDAPAQVLANGVIDWGRLEDGDGNWVMDGNVRMPADSDVASADFVIDNATVLIGGFVVLVSALIVEGG